MSNPERDMDERYRRVCICDCNNGRFLSSISKRQMEIIHDVITKAAISEGDWFTDPIKNMVIETVNELKEYVSDK